MTKLLGHKLFGLIGLIALLVWGVKLGSQFLGARSLVPKNYQKTTETGGPIEQTYLADGQYEVSTKEMSLLLNFGKFTFFYPKELETSNKTYSVIVLANGTGVPVSKYPELARHYASWGFIVVGTEEKYAWDGQAAEMSLRLLERLQETQQFEEKETNVFYQKVALDRVGIVGHSQGGVGVVNAMTSHAHSPLYKAAVALSPTNKELAHNLLWDYDATKVTAPILLLSGEGGGDDWVVTGEQLEAIYQDIPGDKVMARRKQTHHGETLYRQDGYVTAWFMWHLQGDEKAKQAFVGETAELTTNNHYQDVKIDLME